MRQIVKTAESWLHVSRWFYYQAYGRQERKICCACMKKWTFYLVYAGMLTLEAVYLSFKEEEA